LAVATDNNKKTRQNDGFFNAMDLIIKIIDLRVKILLKFIPKRKKKRTTDFLMKQCGRCFTA